MAPPAHAAATEFAAVALSTLRADAPMDLTDSVTDRAGVLGGDAGGLRTAIQGLRTDHHLQLFVVFVDSFDGASGEQWAEGTYQASGMGGDDVLLAVAVQDRRYSTWTTAASGLTAEQDRLVRAQFIEPALSSGDWAGAVRGAVEGYGRAADGSLGADGGGSDPSQGGGGFPWC
jgi:uncharacterized membrane protein YgcG